MRPLISHERGERHRKTNTNSAFNPLRGGVTHVVYPADGGESR